ncbi:MAG: mechanosensitive ion channel family protein [Acidiferrobacterales bacterium]
MDFLKAIDFWIVLAAALIGYIIALLLGRVVARYAKRFESKVADALLRHSLRPLELFLPFFFARVVQPLLELEATIAPVARHTVTLILMFAFAWFLVSLTAVLDEYLHHRFLTGERDDVRARRIITRMGVLRRALVVVIVVVAAGSMLMSFPAARALGASLLASAGIVGLILGIAARPAAENLIAGLQIALTEPITIDDAVIVHGDWGWIEEITMTYVVVRTWDWRRLIVPISYFNSQTFQNWSRKSSDLLGTVTVEVDYITPVAEVREAVKEIVEASVLWDKNVWNVQVVEAGERTVRLRILASAKDPPTAWDLRCEIREKLIGYLQQHHPYALPRLRATVDSDAHVNLSTSTPRPSTAKRRKKAG